MKYKFKCSICKKISNDVRFEGEQEQFICDNCLYNLRFLNGGLKEMKGGFKENGTNTSFK
jgi:hypothetical protein